MNGFLLDANVLSEARRRYPNEGVREFFAKTEPDDLFLSALVVGEIRHGVEKLRRRDPRQAAPFAAWLDALSELYGERILPITAPIAEEWGRLNVPDPLPVVDGLIAATARLHGLTLVTRNDADVRRTGARILNPFV